MSDTDRVERAREAFARRPVCPRCQSEEVIQSFDQNFEWTSLRCFVCGWRTPERKHEHTIAGSPGANASRDRYFKEDLKDPENAILCTQAQIGRAMGLAIKTKIVDTWHKQGLFSYFDPRVKKKFMVVIREPEHHQNLQRLASEEKVKRKRKARKS